MTIDKLKRLILNCTFSNDNNKLRKALNAVDKLVATLQLTSNKRSKLWKTLK